MGQPLAWNETFAVGHKVLDAQHRRLVGLINEVAGEIDLGASVDQLASLLDVLRAVAEEHIRQENTVLWELRSGTYTPLKGRPQTPYFLKLMAAAAFDEHIAAHAAIMAGFDAVRSAPTDKLCKMLRAWFLDHAIQHDAHLKAIFQAAA